MKIMTELYNNYFNIQNKTSWKVAIYVRLSREDEKDDKYKGQSESIENQIKFLKSVVNSKGWILVDIYKDDGYTGTNFNRPNFQRMIEDINRGLVNLVITKDLSRLGRDYIETGKYVEKIFPSKNVRYIAVNDNVDTFDRKNTNNDITPFKSVMNDMYAKDISNKVRTSIVTKAKEGECIKAFLPYGYKKDLKNKNKILIDENVSENIVLIFDLYKSGKSKSEIARILNSQGIKTPLKYKQENTNYFNPNKTSTYKWNSTMITKILRDRIYVGDLVQLKYTKVNYKVQKILKVPEKHQIIIKNNHLAIISRMTFDTVQEMLDKKSNEWNYSNRKHHLLTGLVYCKCGSRITYSLNHGDNFRCVCASYKKYGNKFCNNIHLKEDQLLNMVASSLKKNIKENINFSDLKFNRIEPKVQNNKKDMELLIKKEQEINRLIASLYEDKISNIISQDTFAILIKKYENQKTEYENKIIKMKSRNDGLDEENKDEKLLELITEKIFKFDMIDERNITLVFKLIDKIVINDNRIKIQYKFSV